MATFGFQGVLGIDVMTKYACEPGRSSLTLRIDSTYVQACKDFVVDWAKYGWQEYPTQGDLLGSGACPDGLLCSRRLLPPLSGRQDLHPAWGLRPHHGGRVHLHGGVL